MRKLRIREQNQLAQAHTASKWCTAGIQSEVCLIPKFLSTSLQCQIWETWFSLEKERRDKFEMAYSLLLKFHTIKRGHVIFIFILWIFFSNLDWQFISYMILYMFQCHSPKSSHPHPLPLPQSPKDCSIHLCLFCCLTYRKILKRFWAISQSSWNKL